MLGAFDVRGAVLILHRGQGEAVVHVEGVLGRAESVGPAICIFASALSQKAL